MLAMSRTAGSNSKMARTYTVDVTFFEDIMFQVDISIAPAEPDVGIMSAGIDDWQIRQVDNSTDPAVISFFKNKIEKDSKLLENWMDALQETDYEDR